MSPPAHHHTQYDQALSSPPYLVCVCDTLDSPTPTLLPHWLTNMRNVRFYVSCCVVMHGRVVGKVHLMDSTPHTHTHCVTDKDLDILQDICDGIAYVLSGQAAYSTLYIQTNLSSLCISVLAPLQPTLTQLTQKARSLEPSLLTELRMWKREVELLQEKIEQQLMCVKECVDDPIHIIAS